jgi:hypothetical protein
MSAHERAEGADRDHAVEDRPQLRPLGAADPPREVGLRDDANNSIGILDDRYSVVAFIKQEGQRISPRRPMVYRTYRSGHDFFRVHRQHPLRYATISAVTMPNMPISLSACERMWQWNAHTRSSVHSTIASIRWPGAMFTVSHLYGGFT